MDFDKRMYILAIDASIKSLYTLTPNFQAQHEGLTYHTHHIYNHAHSYHPAKKRLVTFKSSANEQDP
jgi:hypothetical protein